MLLVRLLFRMVTLAVLLAFCCAAHAWDDKKKSPTPESKTTESPIQLEIKAGTLYGVIDMPVGKGPFPILVSIAGSGPTDRDGNQPQIRNNSLKFLGQGLAAQSIAVLRYDRRGIGQSRKFVIREEDLTIDMLADDVVEWIKLLRKDARFSRIGIMGHSEGALVGVIAARLAPADVFVSLAGVGRKMDVVLREQLAKNLPASMNDQCSKIIDELVAGRMVPDPPKELVSLFRPSVQPFLISKFKYHPAEEMAKLRIPTLIVQGTTDVQTMVVDAEALAAAKKDAKLVIIEGMNHVLKKAGTQAEQYKTYYDPALPVMPRALEEIAAFVKGKAGK